MWELRKERKRSSPRLEGRSVFFNDRLEVARKMGEREKEEGGESRRAGRPLVRGVCRPTNSTKEGGG